MSKSAPPNFCAALIAGGKSSRMGSDKRLIEAGGQPLWRRQIEVLQSLQPAELVVSGPPDGPWSGSQYRIIPDRESDCGPLAGIAAVLGTVRSPLVLLLAVDMPQISATYLRSLLNKSTVACGIVPAREDMFEPLAAVYPRDCAVTAEAQLNSGNFSLQVFVQNCMKAGLLAAKEITFAEERYFTNLNWPKDLVR